MISSFLIAIFVLGPGLDDCSEADGEQEATHEVGPDSCLSTHSAFVDSDWLHDSGGVKLLDNFLVANVFEVGSVQDDVEVPDVRDNNDEDNPGQKCELTALFIRL